MDQGSDNLVTTTPESDKTGPPPRRRHSVTPSKDKAHLPPAVKSRGFEVVKQEPAPTIPKRQASIASNLKPRDARPNADSVADLADFVRSTGPSVSPQASTPPPAAAAAAAAAPKRDVTPPTAQPAKKTPPKVLAKQPRPTVPRLQPRSATSTAGGESSDLIDFIRSGPSAPGERRIPLPVAPFQDPLDSDQPEFHSSSYNGTDSINDGRSFANRSYTSFGSNAALLESKDTSASTSTSASQAGRSPTQKQQATPSPSSGPKSMQNGGARAATATAATAAPPRRNHLQARDPYIIDYDDDDDDLDDLLGTPKKKKQPKESLMDFLSNVPPPSEESTSLQPFALSANTYAAATASRSTAGGSSASPKIPILSKKLSKASVRSQGENYTHMQKPPPSPALRASPLTSPSSRAASSSGSFARSGTPLAGTPRTGTPMRETETSALADFLKNTGPPEPPPPVLRGYTSTSVTAGKNKNSNSNSLGRIFGRRKKVEA